MVILTHSGARDGVRYCIEPLYPTVDLLPVSIDIGLVTAE